MESNEKLNEEKGNSHWILTLLFLILSVVGIVWINHWITNQSMTVSWHNYLIHDGLEVHSAEGWGIVQFRYVGILLWLGCVVGLIVGAWIGLVFGRWATASDLKPIKAALAAEKERIEENHRQNEIAHYGRLQALEAKEKKLKDNEQEIIRQYEVELEKEIVSAENKRAKLRQEIEALQQENQRFEVKLQKAIEERTRIKKKNKQTKQKIQKIQKMQKIEQLQKHQRGDNEKNEKNEKKEKQG